jgi:hypothetical protein
VRPINIDFAFRLPIRIEAELERTASAGRYNSGLGRSQARYYEHGKSTPWGELSRGTQASQTNRVVAV